MRGAASAVLSASCVRDLRGFLERFTLLLALQRQSSCVSCGA
jgi:hypothetical protein